MQLLLLDVFLDILSLRGPFLSRKRKMLFVYFLSCVKETPNVGSIVGQLIHPWAMHLVGKHSVSLLSNSVVLKCECGQEFK